MRIAVIGFGTAGRVSLTAVRAARAEGIRVGLFRPVSLSPFPYSQIEELAEKVKGILVVEMNDEGLYGYGQFAGLLRARFCDPKIRGLNKVEGLTWKVKEILERVKQALDKEFRKN